jgi:hypothetical protein
MCAVSMEGKGDELLPLPITIQACVTMEIVCAFPQGSQCSRRARMGLSGHAVGRLGLGRLGPPYLRRIHLRFEVCRSKFMFAARRWPRAPVRSVRPRIRKPPDARPSAQCAPQ